MESMTMTNIIEKLPMKIDEESEPEDAPPRIKYSQKTYSYSVYPNIHEELYLDIIPRKIGVSRGKNRFIRAYLHLSESTSESTKDSIQEFYDAILWKLQNSPEFKDIKTIKMMGPFYDAERTKLKIKFQPNLMRIVDAKDGDTTFRKEDLSRIVRIQLRVGYIHLLEAHTKNPILVVNPCVRKVYLKE
jgi:hypothetical protein